jgi:hypothetical protein
VTVLYNLVDSCLHIGFGDPLHQITTRRFIFLLLSTKLYKTVTYLGK